MHVVSLLKTEMFDVAIDGKPASIADLFPDWNVHDRFGLVIDEARLSDLEDSAYVPPGSNIRGRQMGNQNWRSPEAHAEGRVNKPSDMFSFGIVVSLAPNVPYGPDMMA